jgi:hypothetical protein
VTSFAEHMKSDARVPIYQTKVSTIPSYQFTASPECERKHLHVGIEELELEPSVGDRHRLSDQLIQALLDDGAAANRVNVVTAGRTRRLAVDPYPKTDLTVR